MVNLVVVVGLWVYECLWIIILILLGDDVSFPSLLLSFDPLHFLHLHSQSVVSVLGLLVQDFLFDSIDLYPKISSFFEFNVASKDGSLSYVIACVPLSELEIIWYFLEGSLCN